MIGRYLYQFNWQGFFFLVTLKIIVCFSIKLPGSVKCITNNKTNEIK